MAGNNALNANQTGIQSFDGTSTFNGRTISAGSSKLSVSNGNGVSGNPSIDAVEANFTLNNIGGTLGETKGGTGQTTYATGDILYASASNTLSKLSAGSDDEVLTLASGVPTWAAAGGSGGAWTLISASSASSVATLDFTTLSTSYNSFVFLLDNIAPASDVTLFYMRVSTDGGSSFATTNYDSKYVTETSGVSLQSNTGEFNIYGGSSGAYRWGAGTNEIGNAQIWLYYPQGTRYTFCNWFTSLQDQGNNQRFAFGSGCYQSTSAVDAVRFLFNSGNIATIQYRLYGVTDS